MSTRKQDGTIPDSPSRTQLIELFPAPATSVAADSHPGFQRDHNEDSFGTFTDPSSGCVLLFVADGVGGNTGGELASQYTAKSLLAQWRRFAAGRSPGADETVHFFRNTLEDINRTVYGINADQGTLSAPMGTTVAAVALLQDHIVVAHSGDSRVYRFRNGRIECLTEDHSLVQKWVREGVMTEADAKIHPMSHVIYKSIGQQRCLEPDIRILDRKHGDKFIVCSDGLMCHASDPEIRETVNRSGSAQEAVRELISTALKRGGFDNVTVACYFQA
jgi:protein phosphatase